jgi:hypothetical protein
MSEHPSRPDGPSRLTGAAAVTDFWSGAAMDSRRVITIADMPAHSARLLECRDV